MANWPDPEDRLLDTLITQLENSDFSCLKCRHLNKNGISCKAFPVNNGYGIPSDILEGQIRHNKPMFGQKNNIVFERG